LAQKIRESSYDYADEAVLLPHEALRMELLRLQRTLPYFDPESHPWKADHMNKWIRAFFVPVLRLQLQIDQNAFYTEYLTTVSGAVDDDVQQLLRDDSFAARQEVFTLLDKFLSLLNTTCRLAKASRISEASTRELIIAECCELRRSFLDLERSILLCLVKEEEFWPAQIRSKGEVR
jgi:hypothetical protein